MADLRSYIQDLQREEELIEIDKPIDTKFQASSLIKKHDGKKAILFKTEKKNRIVSGICGTKKKLSLALGMPIEKTRPFIMKAINSPQSPDSDGALEAQIQLSGLDDLPILTHFDRDGGPFITSAIVSAKIPGENKENVSFHRFMVIDNQHMAIRIVPRHLYRICKIARDSGQKTLDIGIAIGLHPAVLIAAACPAQFGISEYGIANRLLNGELQTARCKTVDANVPADSEIVIEGKIFLDKDVDEGPFVDMTGTYDIIRKQPLVKVENIFCRKDFIYHALLPSGMEHGLLMGMPQESKIAETVAGVVPKIKDVNLTPGGCHWLHAVVSIEKQTEGDAKNAILAAFAGHPSLKQVIIVDTDIDVNDMKDVEWAIATRFQGDRGLVMIKNARGSSLDPSGDQELNLTTKIGIDATITFLKQKGDFEKANIPLNHEA
jgi:2,5-furandicarboxylate decarboxylase 1